MWSVGKELMANRALGICIGKIFLDYKRNTTREKLYLVCLDGVELLKDNIGRVTEKTLYTFRLLKDKDMKIYAQSAIEAAET